MASWTNWVEASTSYNRLTGTLRGLHFQAEPHLEVKLVRCTRGAPSTSSSTCRALADLRWAGRRADGREPSGGVRPAGFAHGFQTLVDDTELCYQMSAVGTAPSSRAACAGTTRCSTFGGLRASDV